MSFRLADFYDRELRGLQPHFRRAADAQRPDRVLDIGCGAGETTRDAARLAVDGSALGVDTSEALLRAARQRAEADGLRNVAFECGDAAVHPFVPASFDRCISRFGTMFFGDPPSAFANLARAMRPQAPLVLMVWQARARNPWSIDIQQALGQPDVPEAKRAAFSLADRARTTALLAGAGFVDVAFEGVDAPVCYGTSVQDARATVSALFDVDGVLDGGDARAAAANRRVDALLARQLGGDGVSFDASAWIVTARRG